MKTYKYRLYPTKNQTQTMTDTLEACRVLYNCALEQRKTAYKQFNISVRRLAQQVELLEIKEYFPEYKQIYSQVLQEVILRVDTSFQNFFRRIKTGEKPGYPRFKGRGWYDSFTYPQSGFSLSANCKGNQKLKLSKIGNIKVKVHRAVKGKIRTCTIKKELNNWYVCLACKVDPEALPKTYKDVGIDVGLEKFKAQSDGIITPNPRFLREAEAKLKHEQRILSRKKKGSNSRQKQRNRLAKLHFKVKNQRLDFAHKESRTLVNNYDVIVFEDLKVKNMVKNHHLAKSISDAAWNKFIQFTSYKAESAGKKVVLVSPINTSQICSKCGNLVKKGLSVRVHKCPYCGLILDRDINAAINILRLGTNPGGTTALAG
ncbi:transposase [Bacteroides sp.]|uniref:RNA-guided endonuclease InsQ/TnpB family protein n=1 Tax=Bacteroides sp. TaxID=29523 RepID=UPI002637F51B|nr:transposase [Bacteroides sp.]MDD3040439.1 transposase [Bacteroides sp.]